MGRTESTTQNPDSASHSRRRASKQAHQCNHHVTTCENKHPGVRAQLWNREECPGGWGGGLGTSRTPWPSPALLKWNQNLSVGRVGLGTSYGLLNRKHLKICLVTSIKHPWLSDRRGQGDLPEQDGKRASNSLGNPTVRPIPQIGILVMT